MLYIPAAAVEVEVLRRKGNYMLFRRKNQYLFKFKDVREKERYATVTAKVKQTRFGSS